MDENTNILRLRADFEKPTSLVLWWSHEMGQMRVLIRLRVSASGPYLTIQLQRPKLQILRCIRRTMQQHFMDNLVALNIRLFTFEQVDESPHITQSYEELFRRVFNSCRPNIGYWMARLVHQFMVINRDLISLNLQRVFNVVRFEPKQVSCHWADQSEVVLEVVEV